MLRRALSTFVAPPLAQSPEALLLRNYIHRSLYDPVHGYFSKDQPPVITHETKINISELPSRAAYQQAVARTYAKADHGWMTPVELFSPFLSRAIANRIQGATPNDGKVHIIEIGGGRGTLAADMLDYWSGIAPSFLQHICYNLIEVSPTLASLQSEHLRNWINSGHVKVHNADALFWFQSLNSNTALAEKMQSNPCHVIALEVLDNLPHDLLRLTHGSVQQAVASFSDEALSDSSAVMLNWRPEIDETTNAAVQAFDLFTWDGKEYTSHQSKASFMSRARSSFESMLTGGKRDLWVPTVCYQLLNAISSVLPHANMTISDFDYFPGTLTGENAPVIQRVQQGSPVVYDSVTGAPFGKVDIMFPTDFDALERCHRSLSWNSLSEDSHLYSTKSQQQFFEEHSPESLIHATTCKDGYNPVLQDFENASFFLVDLKS